MFVYSRYLRCSSNTNAQNWFVSKSLYGNALTSSSHKDTFPPLIAICHIIKSQCQLFSTGASVRAALACSLQSTGIITDNVSLE